MYFSIFSNFLKTTAQCALVLRNLIIDTIKDQWVKVKKIKVQGTPQNNGKANKIISQSFLIISGLVKESLREKRPSEFQFSKISVFKNIILVTF